MICFLLIFIIQICFGMDEQCTPEELSAHIDTQYAQQEAKFKEYDLLNNPQKIVVRLQKQLKKETNLNNYVHELQLFASKLFLQELFAQDMANIQYFISVINAMHVKGVKLRSQIGRKTQTGFLFEPDSLDQINEAFYYSSIIIGSEFKEFNPEELQVIFSWMLNPQKGIWLNRFGELQVLLHEIASISKWKNKEEHDNIEKNLHVSFSGILTTQKKIKIIAENTEYFERIIANNQWLIELAKKQRAAQSKVSIKQATEKQYNCEAQKVAILYGKAHQWYAQLYEIVRKELQSSLTELIRQNPTDKSLMNFIKPLPPLPFLPKILPHTLSGFKDPSTSLILPSLEKEIAQAREKWATLHPIQAQLAPEMKIKKIKVKKPKIPKKIKEASDGSYILAKEETAREITIHDPKNKATSIIYKNAKPFRIKEKLPPVHYTDWVKMWFEDPNQALKNQGYTDINNIKYTLEHMYWKPIALHAFPLLIDNVILEWGTLAAIPSRKTPNQQDLLITIPGMIIYPDGSKETGVFVYLIDSANGQWYHRMFQPQSGGKLISDLFQKGYFSPQMEGYYEVFFPPLTRK